MRSFFGETYSLGLLLVSETESKLRYFTIRDLHEKLDIFLIFITLEVADYSHADFTVNVQQAIDAVREIVGLGESASSD